MKTLMLLGTTLACICLFASDFPHGEEWRRRFAVPDGFTFEYKAEKVKTEINGGFTLETWRQSNGPESFQQVLVAVPQRAKDSLPAIVIPAEDGRSVFLTDLVKRGYVTISSEPMGTGTPSKTRLN